MQRDLQDLAAVLRTEVRLEAEEAEREAALSTGMRRSLGDVAEELMAHGDTVALDAGGRIFAGIIISVGADLVTVQAGSWRVDVALGALTRLRVMKRPRVGGLRGTPNQPQSLRARLAELQLEGTVVEVGVTGADEPVIGSVAMVGSDHVAIGPEVAPEWFLPLGAVAFLRMRDARP